MKVNLHKGCPSEEELIDFVDGKTSSESEKITAHLTTCEFCKEIVNSHHRLLKRIQTVLSPKSGVVGINREKVEAILQKLNKSERVFYFKDETADFWKIFEVFNIYRVGYAFIVFIILVILGRFVELQSFYRQVQHQSLNTESSNKIQFVTIYGQGLAISDSLSDYQKSEITGIVKQGVTYKILKSSLVKLTIDEKVVFVVFEDSVFSVVGQQFYLSNGKVDFQRESKDIKVEIKTPHCNITPIGTKFFVQVASDATTVKVERGSVQISTRKLKKLFKAGNYVQINMEGFCKDIFYTSESSPTPEQFKPSLLQTNLDGNSIDHQRKAVSVVSEESRLSSATMDSTSLEEDPDYER